MASLSKLSKAAHIPLILLANSEESASDIGAVATWDDILIGPVSPSHLAGRIAALARLSTMQSELARRFETATRYGVDAPAEVSKPVRVDDAAILVLGKGKYFAAIESNLARHATITGAFTADTALEYLRRRDFDAVLVEVYDSQDEALAFVGDVRRHPRHFNLPILAIGSGLDQSWDFERFRRWVFRGVCGTGIDGGNSPANFKPGPGRPVSRFSAQRLSQGTSYDDER